MTSTQINLSKNVSDVSTSGITEGQGLKYQSSTSSFIPASFESQINSDMKWEYISRYGFTENHGTTTGFNDGTYVFTLTAGSSGSWTYFRSGSAITAVGNKTVTLPGTPPAKGVYYVYIDDTSGSLVQSVSPWTLLDTKVPVSSILWDNSLTPKYWTMDERHTCLIDRRTHYYEHTTEGTKYRGGGVPSGYSVAPASPADTNNTFAISETYISDEDLNWTLSQLADPGGTNTDYVVFYRSGSSTYNWVASAVPFKYTSGNYIEYDSSGSMVVGKKDKVYNSYLLYTNLSGAARYIIVNGRSEFNNITDAQAENPGNFDWTGMPIAEFIIAWQFSWETKAGYSTKGKVRLGVLPKKLNIAMTQTSVSITASHNSLSGLQGGTTNQYYHLTSAEHGLGYINGGRLTLESGVPVSTTDQAGKSTLYFTPYTGDQITLYDGTSWNVRPFTETSLSLTSGSVAGTPFDIWAYDDLGTVTLEKLAWTNTSTRATALAYQNGILIKSGDATRRYLGTICYNSTGTVDDKLVFRGVWNYYNRIYRKLYVNESTAHYSTTTRLWNNSSTNNKLEIVIGVSENAVNCYLGSNTTAASGVTSRVFMYMDGSVVETNMETINFNVALQLKTGVTCATDPAIGYHYFQVWETGNSSAANYFSGMSMNIGFLM